MKFCQIGIKIIGWFNIIGGILLALLGGVLLFGSFKESEMMDLIYESARAELGSSLEADFISKYFLQVLFVIGILILIYGIFARMAGKNPKKSLPVLVCSIVDVFIGVVEFLAGTTINSNYLVGMLMSFITFVFSIVLFFGSKE